ncbi:MAG: hypothetical protein Fur0037_04000 [Planctomycetota bacterium]
MTARSPSARSRRAACLLCAFALGALAAALPSQDELPRWKIDPYTKNRPEAMAKAGYVSFGPFSFGNLGPDPIENTKIEEHLSYARILWLETKHFRLGINLPQWSIPEDREVKAKIRAELTRLAEKLPNVNPKTRKLDPWLRAHLFAQRCEDIYAEFCALAGVKDGDFPASPDQVIIDPKATYMGYGPYLGMKEKYLLLLFEKEGTFKDYMRNYIGRDSRYGQRWHFKDVGTLIYTVSTESNDGRLRHDTALHCDVAFNISQNLLDGFRHYSYELPVWIKEGLGHWFNRRVDPKWNSFDQNEGSPADMKNLWRWEPYCRGMLSGSSKFAPFSEVYAWRDFGQITFNDHVAIWSRIDFLMSKGPERWRKFLFAVKGRVDAQWLPDQRDLVGATRQALQDAYGISVLQFDEQWAEWVRNNYPAQ